MTLAEISVEEYEKLFPYKPVFYSSVGYNLMHKSKCSQLNFLLFQEGSTKIGLIGGIIGDSFLSPFSAPFTTFSFSEKHYNTENIFKAIAALEEYLIAKEINKVQFKIPPYFYAKNIVSKMVFSLYQHKYSFIIDENHYFLTEDFSAYETDTISKGLRYNLKIAESSGLVFKKASSTDESRLAYKVIEDHSDWKKYPMKLTFEQIDEMNNLLEVDFFLVYHSAVPLASSIVYNYSRDFVHILYWGSTPESRSVYSMNFLAKNVFKYYKDKGVKVVDLALSSLAGVPIFGISNFKDTIGCSVTLKFTCTKNLIQNKAEPKS